MITKKICPNCKKVNTAVPVAGGVTGTFTCNNCGYTGTFIEEPITQTEKTESEKLMEKDLEKMKKENENK